jgi:hypothetical protein
MLQTDEKFREAVDKLVTPRPKPKWENLSPEEKAPCLRIAKKVLDELDKSKHTP